MNRIFQNLPNTVSLIQEIMFLGKSLSAKDKIVSLSKDKKENKNIHQLALSALLKNYLDQADALSLNVLNE